MADPKWARGTALESGSESVKTVESLQFCSFLQANKLNLHGFVDSGRRHETPESEAKPPYYSWQAHAPSSSMSTSISPSVPFSLQTPWEWYVAPKWMLLPQWVCTTAENPELREPKSLRMDYKPTCLPSALEGDIVCHTGQWAHLPSALEADTILQSCLLVKHFWKDGLQQSSWHFLRGVQRSKRPIRNCFPVRDL